MTSCAKVIFNPAADRGRAARLRPNLSACLKRAAQEADVALEWAETQSPAHAIALAQEAVAGGCDPIVAMGGDGTVNEVVNGLMRAQRQGHTASLGVIPIGSGNDFAWMAGIPQDPVVACERLFDRLREGQTRAVDVGHIREADGRERYFDNGCGVGFDARVALEVRRFQWFRGFVMYLVSVLKTLIFYHKAPLLHLCLDERALTVPTMMLTIGNGRRHGGGFLVTPDAELDDGLFDICLATKLNRLGMLLVIPRFMRGTHVTHARIQMHRARSISVEAPTPQVIHLDGEIFATDARQFRVEVIPKALPVRV